MTLWPTFVVITCNMIVLLVGWGFRNAMLRAVGDLDFKLSRQQDNAIVSVVNELKDIKYAFTRSLDSNHALVLTQIAERKAEHQELCVRVKTVEDGQDTWTKALRERSHFFDNLGNALVLHVDRLERHVKLDSKLAEEVATLKGSRP